MVHDEIFSPSFGNSPSYLVGRQDIMTSLIEGLSSAPGSKDRAVVLLGQRGSGKTVLLWELAERAAKDGLVVASPTIASEAMLTRIVEKIQESGARYVEARVPHRFLVAASARWASPLDLSSRARWRRRSPRSTNLFDLPAR